MHSEPMTYHADGLEMQGRLYFEPAAAARAGVLVFPEAFGLSEQAHDRAARLAALGYVALACDLHGDGRVLDDLDAALALLKPLFDDPKRMRARGLPALRALSARPEVDAERVAAIGFCFPMPLELARAGAPLKAAVGFHTELNTVAPRSDARAVKARVLVCVGADDPFIPREHRADFETEMTDGGVDWQMHVYGSTVHSFTNPEAAKRGRPDAIRYSAVADARSWAAMLELFGETLTPTASA